MLSKETLQQITTSLDIQCWTLGKKLQQALQNTSRQYIMH